MHISTNLFPLTCRTDKSEAVEIYSTNGKLKADVFFAGTLLRQGVEVEPMGALNKGRVTANWNKEMGVVQLLPKGALLGGGKYDHLLIDSVGKFVAIDDILQRLEEENIGPGALFSDSGRTFITVILTLLNPSQIGDTFYALLQADLETMANEEIEKLAKTINNNHKIHDRYIKRMTLPSTLKSRQENLRRFDEENKKLEADRKEIQEVLQHKEKEIQRISRQLEQIDASQAKLISLQEINEKIARCNEAIRQTKERRDYIERQPFTIQLLIERNILNKKLEDLYRDLEKWKNLQSRTKSTIARSTERRRMFESQLNQKNDEIKKLNKSLKDLDASILKNNKTMSTLLKEISDLEKQIASLKIRR